MARAKQKKRTVLRRLAKRRTRYEAASTSGESSADVEGKQHDSDDPRTRLEVDEPGLIKV